LLAVVTVAAFAALPLGIALASSASIQTSHKCYAVGQAVGLTGRGFLGSSEYDLSVDGIDFGQSVTNASGGFRVSFGPGGLAAGQAQIVDKAIASDGQSTASATFTVTRNTGALVGAGSGSSPHRTVPFEVWDFGRGATIYVHWIGPNGVYVETASLGSDGGQCGYLKSRPRELFPFNAASGNWTLQFDTHRSYSKHPSGRSARITVSAG
jgi:hypothetical protein